MNVEQMDRLLSEWEHLRPASDDPSLEVVRLAMVVEDALGVVLTDEQISHDLMLDRQSLRRLADSATSS